MDAPALPRCGDRLHPPADDGGPLVLSADFPATVRLAQRDVVVGSVTVTNRDGDRFSGVAASAADVFVARAGEVVATPMDRDDSGVAVDLRPGGTQPFPAMVRLTECASTGRLLQPGTYELHAMLSLTDEFDRPLLVRAAPHAFEAIW